MSRATSTIAENVRSRSSALTFVPSAMWSLTVRIVSACAPNRAAIVYSAADSISTASTPYRASFSYSPGWSL